MTHKLLRFSSLDSGLWLRDADAQSDQNSHVFIPLVSHHKPPVTSSQSIIYDSASARTRGFLKHIHGDVTYARLDWRSDYITALLSLILSLVTCRTWQ